jgi:predicted HicB family RNase H-like nuclease
MTNINIEIPDELHKKVKIQCAVEEKTLKDFIAEALEEKIKKK